MHKFTTRAAAVMLMLFVTFPVKAFEVQSVRTFSPHCAPADSWNLSIAFTFEGPLAIGLLPYDFYTYTISVPPFLIREKQPTDAVDGKWHVCGYWRGPHEQPVILYLLRPRLAI